MAKDNEKIFRIVVDYKSGMENLEKINSQLKLVLEHERAIAIDNKKNEALLAKKSITQEELTRKSIANTNASEKNRKTIIALTDARRKANIETKKLAIAENAEKGSIDELSARLTVLRIKYRELSAERRANSAEGRALLKQIRQTAAEYKKQEMSMGNTGVNAGNYSAMYSKLTSITASLYGVKTMVTALITPFKDFEYQMDKVSAVSGATGQQLDELKKSARGLGESTEYTAAQVAELQLNYARLGFSADEILEVTDATLDLATATGEDLARSADIAGATLRGFGLEAKEMPRVIDVMTESLNKSALDLNMFAESMKYVAPIAKSAGVSVEQTSAMLGILADRGIRGSMAGTALRRILTEISISGKTASEALADLNAKGLTVKDAMDEVGRYAMTALSVLADNAPKVETLTTALEHSAGAGQKAAAIMRDNLKGDVDQALSAMQEKAIAFGTTFSGVMRGVVQAFTWFVRNVGTAITAVISFTVVLKGAGAAKSLYEKITKKATAAVVLETAVYNQQALALRGATISAKMLAAAKNLLTGNVKGAIVAIRMLWTALKANPLGLIATAVAGLVGGLTAFYKKATEVTAATKAWKEAAAEMLSAQTNATLLFEALKKTNEGSREHAEILAVIKEKYGDYLKDLIDEHGNLTNIAEAQRIVNDELQRSIALKMKSETRESVITDFTKKQIDGLDELRKQLNKVVSPEAAELIINQMKRTFDEGGDNMYQKLMALCDRYELAYGKWIYRFQKQYGSILWEMNSELKEVEERFSAFSPGKDTKYASTPEIVVTSHETPEQMRVRLAKKSMAELEKIAAESEDKEEKRVAKSLLRQMKANDKAVQEAQKHARALISIMKDGREKDLAQQAQKYEEDQAEFKGNADALERLALANVEAIAAINKIWYDKEIAESDQRMQTLISMMADGEEKEIAQLQLSYAKKLREARENGVSLLDAYDWYQRELQKKREEYRKKNEQSPAINLDGIDLKDAPGSKQSKDYMKSTMHDGLSESQQSSNQVDAELIAMEKRHKVELGMIDKSGDKKAEKDTQRTKAELDYRREQFNTVKAFIEGERAKGTMSDEEYQRRLEQLRGIQAEIDVDAAAGKKKKDDGEDKPSWLGDALGMNKEEMDQLKQQAIDLAQEIGQSIIAIQTEISQRRLKNEQKRIDDERDTELTALEMKRKKGLISEKKYNKLVEAANKEADRKREEAERAAFEREKKLNIMGIAMNVAAGIVGIWSRVWDAKKLPWAVAQTTLLTTAGFIQAAVVASQEYRQGGIIPLGSGDGLSMGLLKGPSHAQGGMRVMVDGKPIGAEVEGDEILAVINKESARKWLPILSQINADGGGKKFAKGGVIGSSWHTIPAPAPLPMSRSDIAAIQQGEMLNEIRALRDDMARFKQENRQYVKDSISQIKVYVSEVDITEVQERVRRIKAKAVW